MCKIPLVLWIAHAAGRKLASFFRLDSALVGPKSQHAND